MQSFTIGAINNTSDSPIIKQKKNRGTNYDYNKERLQTEIVSRKTHC